MFEPTIGSWHPCHVPLAPPRGHPLQAMKKLHALTTAAALASLAGQAQAQSPFFSVDWHSPTVGLPDSGTFTPITHGDILIPAAGTPMLGPLLAPATAVTHGFGGLGLPPGCIGVVGGTPCPVEVDAFSWGRDFPVTPNGMGSGSWQWSVDTFATGFAPIAPNVVSEAPVGDASADVFLNIGFLPPAPVPPGPSIGHRGLFDGDGLYSGSGFTYPGLGLIEPSAPVAAAANPGDNLDALDNLPPGVAPGPDAYFSLDAFFIDPLTGIPNSGSAAANGFMGGDVLKTTLGGLPVVYAPAGGLGLNLLGPGQLDDLDALVLMENGDGIWQPSVQPYDWLAGGTDMLLFSVRRGSAVIGMPDSIFGIPIEEGDILTTPLPTALGGVSPFPGMFLAAENIGLGTIRSGTAMGNTGDDLDALDHHQFPFSDCDGDGMDDTLAIAFGSVPDANMNGIPDSCEVAIPCTPLPNSTGVPTVLTGALTGSPGTGLHLEATSGPPSQFGYFLIGSGLASPGLAVGSGMLCLDTTGGNLIARYNLAGSVMNSIGIFDAGGVLQNAVGTSTVGSGFDVPTPIPLPIGGAIVTGSTWHFQLWHRDIPSTSNFSNALSWTF